MPAALSTSARNELKGQVAEALVAHHEWIARLESALLLGRTSLDPDEVAQPDRCRIGKWLDHEISHELRETSLYKITRGRHATFHREAANVLRAILDDEEDSARVMLAHDGSFGCAAAAIVEALNEWLKLSDA